LRNGGAKERSEGPRRRRVLGEGKYLVEFYPIFARKMEMGAFYADFPHVRK